MQPLDKSLRNKLEKTVKEARVLAEKAARSALEQLGVEQAAPYEYLTQEQRDLRRRLRAHGRQLGDVRNTKTEEQEISRLIEEMAYEHWHRMLFARFLAENGLLMYFDGDSDQDGVAVTLAECDELAAELGLADGWELAARMAARMLPRIFRPDSPVFALALPPNDQRDLERLLDSLPIEVFTASDSLGWVYQFWQADNKDRINASEVKIGARELPAVTQLFTEPYMVSFLLDNALGAWWAGMRLTDEQRRTAETEEELRQMLRLPGVPLEYLRFVRDEAGEWTPAAGTFSTWPEKLSELKVLDPCCGSGHFLMSALLMLVPLRMEREGLSARDACDAVLRDNLHGLEIDPRCVELAAFALALTAWRFPQAGGYRPLPTLQVACSGLSINAKKEDWLALGGNDSTLRMALEQMCDLFAEAPMLGSLINPAAMVCNDGIFSLHWADVMPVLRRAIDGSNDVESLEMGVAAAGMTEAAKLLAGKYHWIVTNVPYLARGKQADRLKDFCDTHYSFAKNDLATVFLDRCLEFCISRSGLVSVVLPQNWLFMSRYKKLRERLLMTSTWRVIGWMGENGFASSSAAGAFTALLMISRGRFESSDNQIFCIDALQARNPNEKAELLADGSAVIVCQGEQYRNPDSAISLKYIGGKELLGKYVKSIQGLGTSDNAPFIKCFWELPLKCAGWEWLQSAPDKTDFYRGLSLIFHWEEGNGRYYQHAMFLKEEGRLGGWQSGREAWGKRGISVAEMRDMFCTIYIGAHYCPVKSLVKS